MKNEISTPTPPSAVVKKQPKRAVSEPYVTYEIMRNNKAVPIAQPADFISLTPVVIPMPIVPYMTQMPGQPKSAPQSGGTPQKPGQAQPQKEPPAIAKKGK